MAITGFNGIPYEAGENVRPTMSIVGELAAQAAITKGLFVKLVSDGKVNTQDATVAGPVGIALDAAASGANARVLIDGIGTVTVGTEVKIGDYVKVDANGKAAPATYGTDDIVGITLGGAAAGGVAVVMLKAIRKDTTTAGGA